MTTIKIKQELSLAAIEVVIKTTRFFKNFTHTNADTHRGKHTYVFIFFPETRSRCMTVHYVDQARLEFSESHPSLLELQI